MKIMLEWNTNGLIHSFLKKSKAEPELHTEQEILEDICRKIGEGSDLEKEKRIHDIIIRNVEYDDSGGCCDHEQRGPILRQKGVCDGISKLADTLFKMNGIESSLVYGVLCMGGETQGGHAWNQVCISGTWYHLDITEDLALSEGWTPYRYDYFNLSDKEISLDHSIEHAEHPCEKSGDGFYETHDLYVQNISEFRQLLAGEFRKRGDTLTVKLPRIEDSSEMERRLNQYVVDYCRTILRGGFTIESRMNPDQMIYSIRIV